MNLEILSCPKAKFFTCLSRFTFNLSEDPRSAREHSKTRARVPAPVVRKLTTMMATISRFPKGASICHCRCRGKYLGLVLSVLNQSHQDMIVLIAGLCKVVIISILLSTDTGYFYILATVDSAAMDME